MKKQVLVCASRTHFLAMHLLLVPGEVSLGFVDPAGLNADLVFALVQLLTLGCGRGRVLGVECLELFAE